MTNDALLLEPDQPDIADSLFDEFPLTDPDDIPADGRDSVHARDFEDLLPRIPEAALASAHVNPSGMGSRARIRARDLAMHAAALQLAHPAAVHYTQGARRWEGIRSGDRAWRGEFPKHGDCSSSSTWWLWNGLTHYARFRHVDLVNGLHWQAGYTGTQLLHGRSVIHLPYQRGDLVLYGTGWPGEHVAMYIGGGLVISHGSEAGPFKLSMHYRGDVIDVRRYI
jgi:hypothetical protein